MISLNEKVEFMNN